MVTWPPMLTTSTLWVEIRLMTKTFVRAQSERSMPGGNWFQAFQDLPREHGFEALRVEGQWPAALTGTLYRNGPARFHGYGHPQHHWFDGDGAVSAVHFDGRTVMGAVRLVESDGLQAERRAGRSLYSTYGTLGPSWKRRLGGGGKNSANTSVLLQDGRLFALFEGGKPIELSPEDLTTIGETDLGGQILGTFSAHPHYDRRRRSWYNIGLRYGRETRLDLYAWPDGGAIKRLVSVTVPPVGMVHDFILTERHLVLFLSPLRFRPWGILAGLETFAGSLSWQPQHGTEILLVPLDEPSRPVRFTAEPFFQWHFANAFEQAGELVVDLVRYPDFGTNRWLGGLLSGNPGAEAQGRFCRVTLDPHRQSLRQEILWDRSVEFPRVSPLVTGQAYRDVYVAAHASAATAGMGPFDRLARLDVTTGETVEYALPAGHYPSEPVIVPRPGATADEAYLLSLVYDATTHASYVAVYDCGRPADEPLARAWFDHHVPLTFHGGWARA